ncbi:MAG TPA: class II fructose-bisphosphate aldolase family protein [Bacilli bacterium]|nr:class II fructose-bisphosphate aldolase family protein [Bacilli bacterium]
MPLVNAKEMLAKATANGYAIGCFNIDSIAMAQAVLEAADELNSPVMLSLSKGSRAFMHPGNIKDMVNVISANMKIPFALHLDHGHSIDLCKECIDEGFTSVMFDGSGLDFDTNVALTKDLCTYAHAKGATVEAELGPLDAHATRSEETRYTNPEQAIRFIKETGVDCLAVSVGTGHGLQKFLANEVPHIRYDILKKIKAELPSFPLVLHGASHIDPDLLAKFNQYGGQIKEAGGIPEQLLIQAMHINVSKINIATDFRMTYITALREALANHPSNFEPRIFLAPAKEAVKQLVKYKLMHVFNSVNRI